MNGYAFLMSQTALDVLLNTEFNAINSDFINVLSHSLVLSGIAMEFAGSSRPVSGSEHLFSHALDYYSNSNNYHGIQVALGTVAILKLLNKEYKHILMYLNKFHVVINPLSLKIDKQTFILALKNASSMRTNRYTCLNETSFNDILLSTIYDELVEELPR